MAKFPEPPDAQLLGKIKPDIITLPMGILVTRIYYSAGKYASAWNKFRYFGPTASRFDHHLTNSNGLGYVQDRGVMYLSTGSEAIPTALAEVFQGTRIIDRSAKAPFLVSFRLKQPVQLLDLRGAFATKIGSSMVIHSGNKPRARRWAQQLYIAYPEIDGLSYCSSMNANAPAIALFERAKDSLPPQATHHWQLVDPMIKNILIETAQRFNYNVI